MLTHLVSYLFAFFLIWLGAGIAITSVERLSRHLKLSTFDLSFIILGFFTSLSELAVGFNALLGHDPQIYVGNLIGASIVLFMLVIPLLAIVGHNLTISQELRGFNLAFALAAVALPAVLALDGRIDLSDSVIALIVYFLLVMCIQGRRGLLESLATPAKHQSTKLVSELSKIIFAVLLIFFAGNIVVSQTAFFAQALNISPFLFGLLFIAIGTNIPELSFVVRSIFMRDKQVAFGDYVGSAAFNTFLLGAFTLLNGQPVILTNNYSTSLLFLVIGLGTFYYFARTKNNLSRTEGCILLTLYISFVLFELMTH